MSITTFAAYQRAYKQSADVNIVTHFGANGANTKMSGWVGSGGSLAIGNTANGLVPTDGTTGAIPIDFASGVGYLTWLEFVSSTDSRGGYLCLYDRLFHCGSYNFNSNVTLASQPSFSGRVPSGTDFHGLLLLIEGVTLISGSLSVDVGYTDQDGNPGHSTGTVSVGTLAAEQIMILPLAAGDSGVQQIESVTATVASGGTFNIIVARPLWMGLAHSGAASAGSRDDALSTIHTMEMIGMPEIYPTSCLAFYEQMFNNGGALGGQMRIEIAS